MLISAVSNDVIFVVFIIIYSIDGLLFICNYQILERKFCNKQCNFSFFFFNY